MEKERLVYSIRPTRGEDIPTVVELLQSEPDAVIPLTEEQLMERIENGLSFVAINQAGEIIGHQGAMVWEQSGIPEIGSAVVLEECRGNGISTELKKIVIGKVQELFPDKPIMVFTEAASKSRGIVQKLNFEVVSMDSLPMEIFNACPKSEEGCYAKTKSNSPDCGCIVFMLKPKGE